MASDRSMRNLWASLEADPDAHLMWRGVDRARAEAATPAAHPCACVEPGARPDVGGATGAEVNAGLCTETEAETSPVDAASDDEANPGDAETDAEAPPVDEDGADASPGRASAIHRPRFAHDILQRASMPVIATDASQAPAEETPAIIAEKTPAMKVLCARCGKLISSPHLARHVKDVHNVTSAQGRPPRRRGEPCEKEAAQGEDID